MGARTEISWCDATFNPWLGCTKVSPACHGCYAEAMMDLRYGRVEWGAPGKGNGTRVRTSAANWKLPIKWNKEAGIAGTRPRVFCASLADVFDNQVSPEWREDLFELIAATPNLVWLLLTKRPQNIMKMIRESGAFDNQGRRALPSNAALGTTCEDQQRADRNLTELLRAANELRPAFTFGSFEPLLGPIDISLYLRTVPALGWVIAGGETDQGKHKARPSHHEWFQSLRDQCARTNTPFHFKQWGEHMSETRLGTNIDLRDLAPNESVAFGDGKTNHTVYTRVGKKKSGRALDGVEHNGFPEIANTPVTA